ncbi:MAG: hypothetical protein AAF495_11150 [Pseudomonadota bacterium]
MMRAGAAGLALLTFLVLLFLATSPARAIEPGALRDKIAATIDTLNLGLTREQGATYSYDAIEVEPRDDHFRVNITGLEVLMDGGDGTRLLVGTAAFTMHPAGELAGDGVYRVSDAEIPNTMGVVYGDGSPQAGVRMGDFSLDALWSFAYLTTLSLDLAVDDIEIVAPSNQEVVGVRSVVADVRTDQKAGDRYDVVLNMQIDELAGGDESGGIEVGKMVWLSRITDYDLAAAAALYGEIREALKQQATPEEQTANMIDLMFTKDFWRVDSETQIGIKNLRASDNTDDSEVTLDSMELGFILEDANQALARTSFGFNQSGLKVVGGGPSVQSPLAQGLMPEESAFQLDIDRLPLKEIVALLSSMANQAMLAEQTPEGQEGGFEAMMLPLVFQLNQLMTEAGTVLTIRDSGVQTSLASLDMAGTFDVDPQAAYGVKGGLLANLLGLDALLQAAQQAMSSEDQELQDFALNVMLALGSLQAYTDRSETDGQVIDRYDLKVEPSGLISVNGQPLLPAAQ